MGDLPTPQGLLQASLRICILPALKIGKLGCSHPLKWPREKAVIFHVVLMSHLPLKCASLHTLIASSKYLNTMH